MLDFKRAERESICGALEQHGITADDKIIDRYSKINDDLWKKLELGEIKKSDLKWKRFQLLAEEFGFEYDSLAVSDSYAVELSEKSHLLGNALEICQNLSKTHRLYLITNGFKFMQRRRFDLSPLVPLFSGVFISEEIGYEKPAIQYFEAVASSIENFDSSKTLVIGDSISSDILGGINAGIDVCWFNPEHKPAPINMNITYIINDLNQLYNITK